MTDRAYNFPQVMEYSIPWRATPRRFARLHSLPLRIGAAALDRVGLHRRARRLREQVFFAEHDIVLLPYQPPADPVERAMGRSMRDAAKRLEDDLLGR